MNNHADSIFNFSLCLGWNDEDVCWWGFFGEGMGVFLS